MPITMKVSDCLTSNVRYVTKYFDTDQTPPVQVDISGPQVLTSSNAAMATVVSQDDSSLDKVSIFAIAPVLGTVTVGGSGDADMSTGERLIPWSDEITVVSDEADSADVSAGELVPK